MKTILTALVVEALLLVASASIVSAQDWMKLDPKMLKLLVDTTLIRAYEVTLAPGEKSNMHTHPAGFFYALTDVKINVHYSDGDTVLSEGKAGDSGFGDPERPHWIENIGNKPVKWIELELKEHPYKKAGEITMSKTFMQIVSEAMAEVPGISPQEAQRRMKDDPRTLVVDVRDAADAVQTGVIPGALNISLGMLAVRADSELPEELRHLSLQNRSRPVITTCALGPNGARGAKELKDMGFTNVCYLSGGMQAWVDAGFQTEPPK